jgi:cytoskeleton protein RodZ
MSSVGAYLRDLRERRGLSLEEVARATRVASRYLEQLERDEFTALPAPVFTRGFIRAYCQTLAEPPDDALALYERRDGTPATAPVLRPPVSRPSRNEPRSRGAVLVSFVLLVVLGMALFAVSLMIQPQREERAVRRAPAVAAPVVEPAVPAPPSPMVAPEPVPLGPPTPPVGVNRLPTSSTPPADARPPVVPPPSSTATSGPAPGAPKPASAVPAPPPVADLRTVIGSVSSPYHLIARTSEMTWLRVRTEDGRITEENVPAGQVREWVSDRPFVLTIGNAGGVSFELNGRRLPPLGGSGAVLSRIVVPPEG